MSEDNEHVNPKVRAALLLGKLADHNNQVQQHWIDNDVMAECVDLVLINKKSSELGKDIEVAMERLLNG